MAEAIVAAASVKDFDTSSSDPVHRADDPRRPSRVVKQ